jgi:hypothetical protein
MMRHSLCAVGLASAFAACAVVSTPAWAAPYDGSWSVVVVPRSGACSQSYRYGVQITNGVVYYAGGGPVSVSGRVSSSGAVRVTVSAGGQYAAGSGRLGRSSGGGSWRGQGPTGSCAGVWSASRGG